jgi:hypothetical protein
MAKKKQEVPAGNPVAAPPTPPADHPLTESTVSVQKTRKFQAFERMIVRRSALRLHETNPRTIDPHAFRKLREFLRKRKLLGALQVNRRRAANGFDQSQDGQLVVIGGHQRIKAMDDISGFPDAENSDYEVPIDVAELTPAQERETLVALNNPGLQGAWDWDMLSEVLTAPGVDPLATGFDRAELASFIDAGILDQIIGGGASAQVAAETPILADISAIAETGRAADAADRAARATVQTTVSIPQSSPDAALAAQQAAVDGMKARRQEYQQSVNADTNTANFMIALFADTEDEKVNLLTHLGLDPGQDFFSLSQFMEHLANSEPAEQQEA